MCLGRAIARFTVRHAREVCSQAVHAMHDAGIVDGDLKPGNVRLDSEGHVCILDVESAIVNWQELAMTVRSRVMHTNGYAAPEVLGGVDCPPASDVYSLGVMLRDDVRAAWVAGCHTTPVPRLHGSMSKCVHGCQCRWCLRRQLCTEGLPPGAVRVVNAAVRGMCESSAANRSSLQSVLAALRTCAVGSTTTYE